MNQTNCLIITSVADSKNKVLNNYAKICSEKNTGFILAGDVNSPEKFELPGCEFLSIETQNKLPFKLAKLLPDHCYSKKNLAYLQAINQGYTILVETDDDNLPLEGFWTERRPELYGDFLENTNWTNVYRYFSDEIIWPRGFLLTNINNAIPKISPGSSTSYFCPVQQGLANENPDVDAIYRLTRKLPVHFKERLPVILGNNSICPFNSQNTTWFKQAFPLLYLPSYCSFRMTDIWRSFIAQRILWTNGWKLGFHSATVRQERNNHNLLKDLEQEVMGYLHNEQIMTLLSDLNLKSGENNIPSNMFECYRVMVENNFIDKMELGLLEAWLNDLEKLVSY